MDIEKTVKNLERRGFEVSRFETKEEAAEYLTGKIHDTTVGIGGCKTAQQMGLYEKLFDCGNEVYWHWVEHGDETLVHIKRKCDRRDGRNRKHRRQGQPSCGTCLRQKACVHRCRCEQALR